MKSHFHITLADVEASELMRAAKLIGAKCTTIDLHRDARSQRDRMLTKYQKDDSLDLMRECVSKLESAGFKVLRYKLERMYPDFKSLFDEMLTKESYGEIHIKTDASAPEVETGFFQLSSNAEEVNHRFYNARIYCKEDKFTFLLSYIKLLENNVRILGCHIEKTVYDSKYSFDSWWA